MFWNFLLFLILFVVLLLGFLFYVLDYNFFFPSIPFDRNEIMKQRKNQNLPLPGEFILNNKIAPPITEWNAETLKVVSWNIERGYNLQGIIETLKKLGADVLLLQELDWNNKRTGYMNICDEIAKALRMNYLFVCEFIEISSPLRTERLQGGGVHGNAILSKFPLSNCSCITHKSQFFDWEKNGNTYKQPRIGKRAAGRANINIPGVGTFQLYTIHLENNCGPFGRLEQFHELVQDNQRNKLSSRENNLKGTIFGGDFNTLMNGISRLNYKYCDPEVRWTTLGKSEAQWWEETMFNSPAKKCKIKLSNIELESGAWSHLVDPFHKDKDFTIQLINGWLFTAKIDWLLVEKPYSIVQSGVIDTFHLSDHKLIHVSIFI